MANLSFPTLSKMTVNHVASSISVGGQTAKVAANLGGDTLCQVPGCSWRWEDKNKPSSRGRYKKVSGNGISKSTRPEVAVELQLFFQEEDGRKGQEGMQEPFLVQGHYMFAAPKVEGWDMVKRASHSLKDLDKGSLCLQEDHQRSARHSMITSKHSSKHLHPLSLGVETALCYNTPSISEFFKPPHIYE